MPQTVSNKRSTMLADFLPTALYAVIPDLILQRIPCVFGRLPAIQTTPSCIDPTQLHSKLSPCCTGEEIFVM
jgi:hypothetical protein